MYKKTMLFLFVFCAMIQTVQEKAGGVIDD